MRKFLKGVLIFFLILLLLAGAGFFYVNAKLKVPARTAETSVTINEGDYGRKVFSSLEEAGIIGDAAISYYYSRFFYPSSFKAGTYSVPAGLDLKGIIDYVSDDRNAIQNTVTIYFREDDNVLSYAKRIAENFPYSEEEVMTYWNDPAVLKELISEYEVLTDDILGELVRYPLEGYLAPNTYEFYADASLEDITKTLLSQSESLYEEYKSAFAASNYTIHEIFTMASIVQYESGTDDENDMQKVAGVFDNRLAIWMPLQSTVTACYGKALDKDACRIEGDWYSTTQHESPYNTYLNYGLPPGPILNAGEKAIYAALYPINEENGHPIYYFVGESENCYHDGHNHFAETLEEHNRNIGEYVTCQ